MGNDMSRFRGRFDYAIDEKGRVSIPAKFRKALSPDANETFIICRAPNGCLRAYAQDVWNTYEDELSSRPQTPETLRHQRLVYNTLAESTIDAQGRVSLTALQMTMVGLAKNITLVGQNGYIELWDTDRFNAYVGNQEDFDEVFFKSVESGVKSIER
jgi:MraZ protein